MSLPSPPVILYANVYSNGSAIVSFTQTDANPAVSGYYYSINGGTSYTFTSATTSPIVITGLSVSSSYPISLIAKNSTGNSTSATLTLGSVPVITSINPYLYGFFVNFTASSGGNPAPTYYSYSIDGGITFGNTINSTSTPLVIGNLQANTSYSLSIKAGSSNWMSSNSTVYPMNTMLVSDAFSMTYVTTAVNQVVTVYLTNGSTYIDWGDSSSNVYIGSAQTTRNHTYALANTYNVTLSGKLSGFGDSAGSLPGSPYLTSVSSFGNLGLTSLTYAFGGVSGLKLSSVAPLPNTVTSLYGLFSSTSMNNANPNGIIYGLENWDVSRVTNFGYTFGSCANFYGFCYVVNGWNTVSATNFAGMFENNVLPLKQFDISNWQTGNVSNFGSFLRVGSKIDMNLGKFKMTAATGLNNMLGGVAMPTANTNATLIGWASQSIRNGLNPYWTLNMTGINAINAYIKLTTTPISMLLTATSIEVVSSLNSNSFTLNYFVPGKILEPNMTYSLKTGSTVLSTFSTGATVYANSYCTFLNVPKFVNVSTSPTLTVANATSGTFGSVMNVVVNNLTISNVVASWSNISIGFIQATSTYNTYPVLGYYYSVDGGITYTNAPVALSSNVITDVGSMTTYDLTSIPSAVKLFAATPVGNTTPVTFGSTVVPQKFVPPTITSATFSSNGNVINVNFNAPVGSSPLPSTYFYSVNGVDYINANANLIANTFTIYGLTVGGIYPLTLIAQGSIGNTTNSAVYNATFYSAGNTLPNITNITPATTSLVVNYTGSIGAYPQPYYYYQVNSGAYANSGLNSYSGVINITSLTSGTPYRITLMAVNPAGNLISANVSTQTFGIGTQPNIINVASNANSLTVYFNGSYNGYPSPNYYYSISGNVATNYLSVGSITNGNSFVIGNLTLSNVYTVYLLAQNTVGNVYSSNTYNGSPYVLGTESPNIIAVYSNVSSLTVQYTGPLNANPPPYYYYSVDGQAFANSGINANAGNLTIPNITVAGNHTVQLMTVNPAGNVVSNQANGTPYFIGAKPDILSVASTANSITVSFQPSLGIPVPIYYYSLNGNVSTSFANTLSNPNASINLTTNTLVIGNLYTTTVYSVFLLAQNAAGNVYSNNAVSAQSSTLGTVPNIRNVYSNLNSLIVQFNATVGGYPAPYYYYSVNGQTAANSGLNTNVGNLVVPNLTVANVYTVQLIAVNTAGNLASNSANGQPYIVGTQPNINSVASVANGLSVSFQASTGGYPAPYYYYSLNGGTTYSNANIFNLTASSFTIGNLFVANTYSVLVGAISVAGNVYSATPVQQSPYTLGTALNITNIYSNLNSLIVEFNASTGGYTNPYYYYSVNGNATYSNTGLNSNASNITILGFTQANVYSVRLLAVNPAGNLASNSANGRPYILGSKPNINSVAPLANAISVSFQASLGGYTDPTYYYSLDGGNTYSNINVYSQTANYLVIGNLYTATTYNVGLLALNAAGNVYSSTTVSQMPYVLGNVVPNITNVYSGVNSLLIQFTGTSVSFGANPLPYYYYSVNGNTYANTNTTSDSANIVITGFTKANTYTVSIMSVSPAGNLISGIQTGQPYIFGSNPNIISVAPLANALSISFQSSDGGYDTPTYYYSLNGNVATAYVAATNIVANGFVIGGLTSNVSSNISLLAKNAAGNVYSATTVLQTPYVVGNVAPTILSVISNLNALSIQFTSMLNANPAPYYYYSVDGSAFSNSGKNGNSSLIYIPGITVLGNHTIQLMAVNPAGNVVSNSANGQPFLLGSQPNIISVAPLANALSVSFRASLGGYTEPTYYYSLNGNVATAYVAAANIVENGFVIGGLTANTSSNISMLAVNAAGNAYSATTVLQNPYVVGNVAPTIISVISNVNALSVQFASALNANPAPYYYYSVDGSAFSNSGQNSNAALIYIPGITVLGNHTIKLMAVNPAGNVASNSANGQPYILGSQPNIISVAPLANALSVSFYSSVGGYTSPTYYYSLNGNSETEYVAAANIVANGFVIGGLTVNASSNISLLAKNAAGNVYSATTVLQTPYVVGNAGPSIFYVSSGINSLIVSFASAQNANPTPYYYYSVDGSAFSNSGQNSNNSSIIISNVVSLGNHTVQLMAVNPAGNVVSNSVNGQPFLLGSQPNIISVAPLANALSVSFYSSAGGYPLPTYYYSLNGNSATEYVAAVMNGNANSFVIGGLTLNASSNISILAVNAAGNVYSSTTVLQTPYVVGNTMPVIFEVQSNVNSLKVAFSAAQNANPPPYYYYSVNGSVFSNSGFNSNATAITIPNISVFGNYAVSIMASNPAGNVITGNSYGSPFTVGSWPNIISVANLANSLSVSFQGVSGWNPHPTYYYSINGNSAGSYVVANVSGNSFLTQNIYVANTYYVDLVAINVAGNSYSANIVPGNPYVLGSVVPSITTVQSAKNSLVVQFAGTVGAFPAPYYYYSVDGSVFSNSGFNSNATAITIPNISVFGNYQVAIMSVSPAGNMISANAFGQPFTVGSWPNIISVANLANSLSVSFEGVTGWNPQPTYYYSINGNSAGSYVAANVSGNGFLISNIYVANTYYVDLVAINVAGNSYSANIVPGNPYVLGSAVPAITKIVSATNSLVVQFSGTVGAFPDPYYYYSVNGSVFSNSGFNSNASNIIISNLTVAGNYQVAIMSVSPAGNMVSVNGYGQPFTVGSWPNIISVANLANSLSVSFQGVSGWNPQPTYYYSINGNSAGSYVVANVSGNSFTVSNIYVANTYYVDLVAINAAGNAYSANIVPGNPYVLGSAVPSITAIQSLANSLVVQFGSAVGAFPDPYYYYSVNGSVFSNSGFNSNATNIIISNLTVAGNYSVSIMSVSPAGNMVSANGYGQPYVIGTTPSIANIASNLRSLIVSFSGSVGSYPAPYYYYSVDGSAYSNSGFNGNSSAIIIPNLTVAKSYTISLLAANPAGNLISGIQTGIPYIVGTQPNIVSVSSLANSLSISFQTSVQGYPAPTYYYSLNGNASGSYIYAGLDPNSNALVIGNLYSATVYSVSMLAQNAAGNAYSSQTVSGEPYVLGTTPSITNIASNLRSLIVSFSESAGAYPAPYYYYSVDGSAYSNTGFNGNSRTIVIGDLNVAKSYTISLLAVNPAGNLISGNATGIPYIVGTQPNIVSVSSLANSLSISFQTSVQGYPAPTYYYSLDGGNTYINSGLDSNANVLVIGNLYSATVYSVSMLAQNAAGNTYSSQSVSGEPYVLGTTPSITNVLSNLNSLIISFSKSTGAYTAPYYYYSVDGSAYSNTGFNGNASNIVISNLNIAKSYTISLLAANPAGNLISGVETGIPYIVGTPPIIANVISKTDGILIHFSGSLSGYPNPTTYYYTLNGGNTFIDSGSTVSPISVGNLATGTYSVGLVAKNVAGNTAISNIVLGQPYVIGTAPVITDVLSEINSLEVQFTGPVGAVPEPYTYLYSLNGVDYVDSGNSNSPIIIGNLITATIYSVSIKAVSLAGTTAPSNTIFREPYVIGVPPVISVDSSLNKLIINWTDISGGYPDPYTFLYSLDGVNYVDASSNANPIIVSGLTTPTTQYVSLKAVNMVGISAPSNTVIATPWIIGSSPHINSLTTTVNGFIVDFSGSTGGYPDPTTYLYSIDGGVNYFDSLSATSPFTIDGLSPIQQYTVCIKAVNAGGVSAPSNSITESPFLIVEAPTINNAVLIGNSTVKVSFTASPGNYPNPFVYFYSVNGSHFMGGECVESPLYITNYDELTRPIGRSMGTVNEIVLKAALEVTNFSSPIPPQYPHVIGSPPEITAVSSILEGLSIAFSGPVGGHPDPATYYYSIDGGDYLNSGTASSPIIIGNLRGLKSYSVSLIAQNLGGNTMPSNIAYGSPYIIGTAPVILDVSGIDNGLVINFTGSTGFNPPPTTYLYSLDGGVSYSDSGYTTSPITITNLSPVEIYRVSLKALNAGGLTAASNSVLATPYSTTTAPVITNATLVNSNLVITFNPIQTSVLYPTPIVYYYSLNGSGQFEGANYTTSPIIVNGVLEKVQSVSIKGLIVITSFSVPYVGQPYVIGTPPTISSVQSIENGLVVNFTAGINGYPEITDYYYSLDGGNTYVDANTTSSPITITGFTQAIKCYVVMIGRNLGGNTAASNVVVQTPYINGTVPVITNVSSDVNSLIVEFTPSVGGSPEPVSYYYSIDGGVNYIDSGYSTSPLVIPNLTTPGIFYEISIKSYNSLALGPASNTVSGKPYVAGYAPVIIGLQSSFQEMGVAFINNGAYPAPTEYYYSTDGVNYTLAEQTSSPIWVMGLTPSTKYNVYIFSVNIAGDSPVSDAWSYWTKSTAAFFRDTMNPTYNLYNPIYIGNQPDNNKLSSGANDTGLSTKQKYSQYVSGTGRTRR